MLKRYALMAAVAAVFGTGTLMAAQHEAGQPGQQPQAGQQQLGQQQGQQQRQQAMNPQQQQEATKRYLNDTYSQNRFETELAKRVSEQAQDPQIKQFAQKIGQDHKQGSEQLQQTAQQANVTLEKEMNPVHKAMKERFEKLEGQELEREYVFAQVAAHHKGLLVNLYQAQSAQDPQIKQFATKQAQTLQQHLQQAQQLAQTQVRSADQPRLMGQIPGQEQQRDQQLWQDQKDQIRPQGQTGQQPGQGQTGQPGQGQTGQQPEQGQTGETNR